MRPTFALILLAILPAFAFAEDAAGQQRATLQFLTTLRQTSGGFAVSPKDTTASLRGTSAGVRAYKYLIGKKPLDAVPNSNEVVGYVMSCYDPISGGFANAPGGKPDVNSTSIGVMAAIDLEIPRGKFAGAMGYLIKNAKTFEEVRLGAAAVEAWGVKECPFDLKPWLAIADKQLGADGTAGKDDGIARETASVIAMKLRLGVPERDLVNSKKLDDVLQAGQWKDGGYGREGAKGSDLESTYRVMRAFMLMHERPKNRTGMRAFIAKCRNADGGYGVQPGEASSVGGVYFAAIIAKWMDDMEK